MNTAQNFIQQGQLNGYKNSQQLVRELQTALSEACEAAIKICVDSFGRSHEIKSEPKRQKQIIVYMRTLERCVEVEKFKLEVVQQYEIQR